MLLAQWGPLSGPSPLAGAFEPTAPFVAPAPPAFAWRDADDAFVLEIHAPGYRRRDLTLEVEGRWLRVRGERQRGLLRPSYQAFEERVTLPAAADPDAIRAGFRGGTLWVSVAKRPEARRRVIPIAVRARALDVAGAEVPAPPPGSPSRGLGSLVRAWRRLRLGLGRLLRPSAAKAALPAAPSS